MNEAQDRESRERRRGGRRGRKLFGFLFKGTPEQASEDAPKEDEPADQPAPVRAEPAAGPIPAEPVGFVDFEVWEATLIAHFGPDFEAVLLRELGTDWVSLLGERLRPGQDFHQVVEELGREQEDRRLEQAEALEQDLEEGQTSFEAVGEGEIIRDSSGPGPETGGPVRERRRSRHPLELVDMTRKEFEAPVAMPERPSQAKLEPPGGEAPLDERLVLMERGDYARLSYLAHKELERHQEEPSLRELMARPEAGDRPRGRAGVANWLVLGGSLLLLGYLAFAAASWLFFTYRGEKFLEPFDPALVLQPSTGLHRQGGLLPRGTVSGEAVSSPRPLALFSYHPALGRLELTLPGEGALRRIEFPLHGPDRLAIPGGAGGDSLVVRRHYRSRLPTSLGGLRGMTLLSLSEGGRVRLAARETPRSGLLPGLIELELSGEGRGRIGRGWLVGGKLHLALDGFEVLPPVERRQLVERLVLLTLLLEGRP